MRIKISPELKNYLTANPVFMLASAGQYIICDSEFRPIRIQDCLTSWATPAFRKRTSRQFERVA